MDESSLFFFSARLPQYFTNISNRAYVWTSNMAYTAVMYSFIPSVRYTWKMPKMKCNTTRYVCVSICDGVYINALHTLTTPSPSAEIRLQTHAAHRQQRKKNGTRKKNRREHIHRVCLHVFLTSNFIIPLTRHIKFSNAWIPFSEHQAVHQMPLLFRSVVPPYIVFN